MKKPFALIAGAGAGFGQSLMTSFHDAGYRTLGVSRSARRTDTPNGHMAPLDLTDEKAVIRLIDDAGTPDVVVHNTALFEMNALTDTTVARFEEIWRAMTLSAFVLGRTVLPRMAERGHGHFLVSGATASLRGGAKFPAFASAKFALRGLTQAMAREYQSRGVHVAHVVIDGVINTPWSRDRIGLDEDRMINPDDLARAYVGLADQPRSAWTFELDFRPMTETF